MTSLGCTLSGARSVGPETPFIQRWKRGHRVRRNIRTRGIMHFPAGRPFQPTWHLTDRECRILELVARGQSSKQVAKTLAISPSTVDTHLDNTKFKLGAHNRASLIAKAIAGGVITFSEDGDVVEHPAPDEEMLTAPPDGRENAS